MKPSLFSRRPSRGLAVADIAVADIAVASIRKARAYFAAYHNLPAPLAISTRN